MFLGMGFLFIIFGFIAWALKDAYLTSNANTEKLKSLEGQIHHCQEMRAAMQMEITYLREENARMKQRVSTLEDTVKNKMP
jgi:cell division protein FtsB